MNYYFTMTMVSSISWVFESYLLRLILNDLDQSTKQAV